MAPLRYLTRLEADALASVELQTSPQQQPASDSKQLATPQMKTFAPVQDDDVTTPNSSIKALTFTSISRSSGLPKHQVNLSNALSHSRKQPRRLLGRRRLTQPIQEIQVLLRPRPRPPPRLPILQTRSSPLLGSKHPRKELPGLLERLPKGYRQSQTTPLPRAPAAPKPLPTVFSPIPERAGTGRTLPLEGSM